MAKFTFGGIQFHGDIYPGDKALDRQLDKALGKLPPKLRKVLSDSLNHAGKVIAHRNAHLKSREQYMGEREKEVNKAMRELNEKEASFKANADAMKIAEAVETLASAFMKGQMKAYFGGSRNPFSR